MAMEDYYEEYYKQEHVWRPTGFPHPFDYELQFGDGTVINGRFITDSSTEMMVSGAQGFRTRGRFATHPSSEVSDGDILRCARDNLYISIIGDAKQAPAQAENQVKTFTAEIMGREL